jgi:hypothetical protein
MHKNGNEQGNILDTERLFLRHLCADDADFMVELLNEPGFLQNEGDRVYLGWAGRELPATRVWHGSGGAEGNGGAKWGFAAC